MKSFACPLACFAFLLASWPSRSQEPVRPSDLWTLPTIDNPVVAPDGSSALYQLRQADQDRDQTQSVLMWIDLESLDRSPLTYNAYDPQWSPDGRFLTFRGRYGGSHGLYRAELVVDPEERSARLDPPLQLVALSDAYLSEGAEPWLNHAWSPDGQWIAYADYSSGPCSTTPPPGSPQIFEPGGSKEQCLSQLYLIPSKGGEAPRELTRTLRPSHSLAWSPDSEKLAFAHTPDGADHSLWTVDIRSDALEQQVGGVQLTGRPSWSTHSDLLAWAEAPPPGSGEAASSPASSRIRYLEPAGSRIVGELEGLPSGLENLQWGPAGQWLYFRADQLGRSCVYRINREQELEEVICREGAATAFDLSAEHILYSYESPEQTGNLFRADLDGLFKEAISFHGRGWMRNRTLAKTRHFDFTAANGAPATVLITYPAKLEETDRLPVVHYLSDGAAAVHGFSFSMLCQVLAGAGFAVVQVEPMGSYPLLVERESGKITGMEDLLAIQREGIDLALRELAWLDATRIGMAAESYGALAGAQLLKGDDRYRAAVLRGLATNLLAFLGDRDGRVLQMEGPVESLGSSLTGIIWEASPLVAITPLTTPILLLHGTEDETVPLTQAEALFRARERAGTEVRLIEYSGEGHRDWRPSSRIHAWEQLLDWMSGHLGQP